MPSSELLNDLISSEHVVLQTLVNAMTLIGGYNGLKGDEKKDLVLQLGSQFCLLLFIQPINSLIGKLIRYYYGVQPRLPQTIGCSFQPD